MNGYQKLKTEIFTKIPAGGYLNLVEFTALLKQFDSYFNVDDQYISEIFTIQNPKDNKVQKESIAKIIDTFYITTKDDFNKYDSYNDLQYIYKTVFEGENSKGTYQIHVEKLKGVVRETTTLQETPDHLIDQISKMASDYGYVSKDKFKEELAKIEESLMYGNGSENSMKKKNIPTNDKMLKKHDSYILIDPSVTKDSIKPDELTLDDEIDNIDRLGTQFEIYLKELFEKANSNSSLKTTAKKLNLLTPEFKNLQDLTKKRHKFYNDKIEKVIHEKKDLDLIINDLKEEIKFKNELLTKREEEFLKSNTSNSDQKKMMEGVFGGLLDKSVNYEFENMKYSAQIKSDSETIQLLNKKITEEKSVSDHLRREVSSLSEKCESLMHKHDDNIERIEKLNCILGYDQDSNDLDNQDHFRNHQSDATNTYKRKVQELENALNSEKMFTTTLKEEITDQKSMIQKYEDKYGPVENINFGEGDQMTKTNFLGEIDDLENLLGLEQNLFEPTDKGKSFDINTLFDKEWNNTRSFQENTTSFILPKKVKENKDFECQTDEKLLIENMTQTPVVIQVDSYTECVLDQKNSESQTIPKSIQDLETQTQIKKYQDITIQTEIKLFYENGTDTFDLIQFADKMLDSTIEQKSNQTETKDLIIQQESCVMTDPLPKPAPITIVEKAEPELKIEYVYIEKEPEVKIEYIYVDPPVKDTKEIFTQANLAFENCATQTTIDCCEKETQIYNTKSDQFSQTIEKVFLEKEMQSEEDFRLLDLKSKAQNAMKDLNNKIFDVEQECKVIKTKLTHSEKICSNLRNDLEKKNNEIKELHEKFEITNKQKQERIKLESLAQKRIQQLDAEIENLKKMNEALIEKEKKSQNLKIPVSQNSDSIIDIYLSRCNLSAGEKNQLVALLSQPLQTIQQQTTLAQLLLKSALTEKDQEHLKQEIRHPILVKLLNKCTLQQDEKDSFIELLKIDILDKEGQANLRKIMQKSSQTKSEVLDLKCLITDPIVSNLLKESGLNFKEQQQLKIQLQTPHQNSAQFSLINTLFHKSNLVIDRKVNLKNYLQLPHITNILDNSKLIEIENEQLKVLILEENALTAQHKSMMAQLLQKSNLTKEEQFAVKGQILSTLPVPIQIFINNTLKNLNLLPNEQEQIKYLLLKQNQTLQEQGLLQQLYHKSGMSNTDIQGLKVLYVKEKNLFDLTRKTALTNSEKSNLTYLLQYATLSPEQQTTQDNLQAKTGLTKDEKELKIQLIRGPLVANLLAKANLSKDEQSVLRNFIEKPSLTNQEFMQMNGLLDKSKQSKSEKIQLVNMLHKLLKNNILLKTGLQSNEQELLHKLLSQPQQLEQQEMTLKQLFDKSKLSEEEKVHLKALFKEPMIKSLLKKSELTEIEQRELRNLVEIKTALNPQQQYNLRCLLEKGKLSDDEKNNLKVLIKNEVKDTNQTSEITEGADIQTRMKAIQSQYNLTPFEQEKQISILLKAEELTLQEKNILRELMHKANVSDKDKEKLTQLIREFNEQRNQKMQQQTPQNEFIKKITELLNKSGLSVYEQDKLVELLKLENLTPSQYEQVDNLLKKSNLTDQEKDILKNQLRKTLYKVNTFDPVNCKDEFEHRQLLEENEKLKKINENFKQELIQGKDQIRALTEKCKNQQELENLKKNYEEKLTELKMKNSLLESNLSNNQGREVDYFESQLSKMQMDYALEKSSMERQINDLLKERYNLHTEMTRLSMDQAFIKSNIQNTDSNNLQITDENFFDKVSRSHSPRLDDNLKDVNFSVRISEPSPRGRNDSSTFNTDEIQLKIENFILKNAIQPEPKKIVRKASIVEKEKAIEQIKKSQVLISSQNESIVIKPTKPKTRVFNESMLLKHDKLELNKSPMISRILQTYGENPKTVEIYSESISRINSLGQRKNKLLMITDAHMYIITSTKQNVFEEKRVVKMTSIGTIKVHATNKGIFQICVKNEQDEVLESFDRNQLCLQIQRKSEECCNHRINIKKVKHIELRTRDNIIANLFSESAIIKNELNEVFRHSDKVGHLKLLVSGLLGNNVKNYTMVLSNIGIIYMSTNDLKCKGFIPIIGTNIKKMPKDNNHSIIVMYPDGRTCETMLFASEFEQEDWFEAMKATAEETHNKYLARSIIE